MKPIATNAPMALNRMFFERENIHIPAIPILGRPVEAVSTRSSLKENPMANRPAVTIADSVAPLSIEPTMIMLLDTAFFA